MSANRKALEAYFAAKHKSEIGPLLADDVEWVEWADGVPPSGVVTRGKQAYINNYGDDDLSGDISRYTEEGNVIVAEGTAHVLKKDGKRFNVKFVDIFEMEHGKIRRKISFGALIKDSA